jgi:hypothetical protein
MGIFLFLAQLDGWGKLILDWFDSINSNNLVPALAKPVSDSIRCEAHVQRG